MRDCINKNRRNETNDMTFQDRRKCNCKNGYWLLRRRVLLYTTRKEARKRKKEKYFKIVSANDERKFARNTFDLRFEIGKRGYGSEFIDGGGRRLLMTVRTIKRKRIIFRRLYPWLYQRGHLRSRRTYVIRQSASTNDEISRKWARSEHYIPKSGIPAERLHKTCGKCSDNLQRFKK